MQPRPRQSEFELGHCEQLSGTSFVSKPTFLEETTYEKSETNLDSRSEIIHRVNEKSNENTTVNTNDLDFTTCNNKSMTPATSPLNLSLTPNSDLTPEKLLTMEETEMGMVTAECDQCDAQTK